jgi:hypothetical protein
MPVASLRYTLNIKEWNACKRAYYSGMYHMKQDLSMMISLWRCEYVSITQDWVNGRDPLLMLLFRDCAAAKQDIRSPRKLFRGKEDE